MRDRKFVQIDRDNFNKIMSTMAPGANLRVKNTLQDDGSEMAVNLKFNSMDDFEPGRIVGQVEPLKRLKDTRDKLRDLLSKADRSEDLEKLLEKVLADEDALKKLQAEIAARGGKEG